MRVVVVGGGLAGLAAALELAEGGAAVTLLEARSRLGGATFSFERHGKTIDNGQHVALRCCTEYLAFLQRLGVAELLPVQRRLRVPVLRPGLPPACLERNGLPAPLHLGASLLRYAPLSLAERLRAVTAALALRRLDPDDPALDRTSFGDWLAEHGQSARAVTALWNLITVATINLPASEASLGVAARVFRTGLLDSASGGDIGVAAVPLQRIHGDAAGERLAAAGAAVRTHARVRSIRRAATGLHVLLEGGVDEGEELAADAVVVAVPPHAVAGLVPGDAADLVALERLGDSPIVNLHVHYDRRVLEEPFAAVLDSPLQFLFDRSAVSGVATGQLVVVSLSYALEEIHLSVAALRERYLPELERLLPAARGAAVLDFAATHEPRATFRAAPGTRPFRPGVRTPVPGLYLAGSYTDTGWPATMESAVRSGLAAARAVLAEAPARVAVEAAA